MYSKIIALVVAVIVGIFGSVIGGMVEDKLWIGAEGAIPNCDSLEGGWKETCKDNNRAYYTGKSMFQAVGFLAPFLIIITVLIKLGFLN